MFSYPGPRGFSWIFCAKEIKSKRRSGDESRKRQGEREKPPVTLASDLTFMQTTGSGSDPRAFIGWFFFQTRTPIWLARLIVTTEETLRTFTPHFASLYQGRKLFACCTRNNICTGPRHVKTGTPYFEILTWMLFLKEYSKKFWPRYLMSAFLSLTEQQNKALFAALSRKDVFTILPDVCKYLSLRGYTTYTLAMQ